MSSMSTGDFEIMLRHRFRFCKIIAEHRDCGQTDVGCAEAGRISIFGKEGEGFAVVDFAFAMRLLEK
jgi:hypothetical protein